MEHATLSILANLLWDSEAAVLQNLGQSAVTQVLRNGHIEE